MQNRLWSIFKYTFSGGVAFLVNISIFWLLIDNTDIWYIYSAIISFMISTLVGFNLHKRITYSYKKRVDNKNVFYYYLLNISNIIVNSLLIFIFVEYLQIIKTLSLILSNILISIYSYILYKRLIFR